MDKKTAGIIGVVAATIICGIPGLEGLCLGALLIIGNNLPDTSVNPADANLVSGLAIFILCLSLVFIAIPIIVVVFIRKRNAQVSRLSEGSIPEDDF
jgi:hypothetical protein